MWLQHSICGPEALVLRANIYRSAKCYLQASSAASHSRDYQYEVEASAARSVYWQRAHIP